MIWWIRSPTSSSHPNSTVLHEEQTHPDHKRNTLMCEQICTSVEHVNLEKQI